MIYCLEKGLYAGTVIYFEKGREVAIDSFIYVQMQDIEI